MNIDKYTEKEITGFDSPDGSIRVLGVHDVGRKINALIDAVEALDKRVKELESNYYCSCNSPLAPLGAPVCINCEKKVRQP